LLFAAARADASPLIEAGNAALRNDIRLLADVGIITGPVSGWPLAWAPILENLRDVDTTGLSKNVGDAMFRVLARGNWETRVDEIQYNAEISAAEKPIACDPSRIRREKRQNSPSAHLGPATS
jgi:hypothetical protein